MEPENDFWYWLSLFVAVVAMLVWAVSSALFNAGAVCGLFAGAIIVLAAGSVGMRAGLKARRVVWTAEMKEAQRRRAWQQLQDSIGLGVFLILLYAVQRLVDANMLPQWAGAVLVLVLLIMSGWWIWSRRGARRGNA